MIMYGRMNLTESIIYVMTDISSAEDYCLHPLWLFIVTIVVTAIVSLNFFERSVAHARCRVQH